MCVPKKGARTSEAGRSQQQHAVACRERACLPVPACECLLARGVLARGGRVDLLCRLAAIGGEVVEDLPRETALERHWKGIGKALERHWKGGERPRKGSERSKKGSEPAAGPAPAPPGRPTPAPLAPAPRTAPPTPHLRFYHGFNTVICKNRYAAEFAARISVRAQKEITRGQTHITRA